MSAGHLLRLRGGATLAEDGTTLVMGMARLPLRDPSPATREALAALAGEGLDPAPLAFDPQLGMLVHQLESGGWLRRTVRAGERGLLTLEPLAFAGAISRRGLDLDRPLQISRFALLRSEGGETVIESGRALARAVVHEPRLATLVATLAQPVDAGDLDPAGLGLEREELDAVLRLLLQARLVKRIEEAGDPEAEQGLAQWSPVDLAFHARSRLGRRAGGYGGTYPFKDELPEPPALREEPAAGIELPKPDLAVLAESDLPLSAAIEARRSVREHDDSEPIDVARLGELLYRTSRVKGTIETEEHGTFALRPYPNGGALYELDVYPAVRLCEGLDPGLYRYDPMGHRLVAVGDQRGPSPLAQGLVEHARVAALMESPPQVLLVIAARFGRVSWKYEAVAYALTLKHVGVLYQTLYLVATAMGLAPCGLGGGDSDLFARAAGLAYEEETSVGEFIVGSRPADSTGPGVAEVAEPIPEW